MKILSKSLSTLSIYFGFFLNQDPYGSFLNAEFNNTSWKCTALSTTVNVVERKTFLQFHAQNPPTNGQIEYVHLSITDFVGKETYPFGKKEDKASLKITFQNISYTNNIKMGGGGNGTIKINEYIKGTPGKPGRIIGEIEGVLKSGDKTLTITHTKFNSVVI